jgi:hypothetical protein
METMMASDGKVPVNLPVSPCMRSECRAELARSAGIGGSSGSMRGSMASFGLGIL